MDRKKLAYDLFLEGCNCSQAVFCAFSDLVGLDIDFAKKLSSGFGGGIGRLRETCGAVSGMVMAASANTPTISSYSRSASAFARNLALFPAASFWA